MIWPFRKNAVSRSERERCDAWPVFVDGKTPVRCWTRPDGDERVFLIRRREGTFTTEREYFSHEEFENCWSGSGCSSIYDSADTATKELAVMYPWIKEVEPEAQDAELQE